MSAQPRARNATGSVALAAADFAPFDPHRRVWRGASTSAVLAFANAGGDEFGAILDNIVLAEAPAAAAPAPTPLALLPLALAAMAARRRRR